MPFLLQHAYYQPHRDEFLYLDYAQHMDWGYMEVPPLLSVFSWLVKLAGSGVFWVKWWPTLIGTATFYSQLPQPGYDTRRNPRPAGIYGRPGARLRPGE